MIDKNKRSLISRLKDRGLNQLTNCQKFVDSNYVSDSLLKNLKIEAELERHTGCVNCLDWNSDGSLLISGSDDQNAIIWSREKYEPVSIINTGHRDNIFSTMFLHGTMDKTVATAAGDHKVMFFDVATDIKLFEYDCGNRVKALCKAVEEPNLVWSASEDGKVREFDLRNHSSIAATELIDLSCFHLSCKTLAVSPANSNIIAVGASDPFVRLYDRRMVRKNLSPAKENEKVKSSSSFVSCFSPGHLVEMTLKDTRRLYPYSSTSVSFNATGSKLLANIGSEQIYLFDVNSKNQSFFKVYEDKKNLYEASSNNVSDSIKRPMLSLKSASFLKIIGVNTDFQDNAQNENNQRSKSDEFKDKANKHFREQKYFQSVQTYSEGLVIDPKSSTMYGNRAAALLKRSWPGDTYESLTDCYSALLLKPNYMKVHFRMAKCLNELESNKAADQCLKEFCALYPDNASKPACQLLANEIKKGLSQKQYDKVINEESATLSDSFDYSKRYCGHKNNLTDIKEATFFGPDCQYVAAGSDDGNIYFWDTESTCLVRVVKGDSQIVNIVQPHPKTCMLATSGIDSTVKIWSPLSQQDSCDDVDKVEQDIDDCATANYERTSPFDHLGIRIMQDGSGIINNPNCNPS